MHQGEQQTPFLYVAAKSPAVPVIDSAPGNERCLSCHHQQGIAKDSVVEHSGHPSRDLVLRSDKTVMPLVDKDGKISEFGMIACITCHEPHHWKPGRQKQPGDDMKGPAKNRAGNVLNSFLRLNRLEGTFCVECHGLQSRIKFKYYHDKISRDDGISYIK